MKVDMSPKAVKHRLKMVSQLWRLSIALGDAKKQSKIEDKNFSKKVKNKPKIENIK